MTTPTIRWNVDADGDWATPADWDLGRLPMATDNVLVDTADQHTVTFSTGFGRVRTLTVGNDDFVVSGGVLSIRAGAAFAQLLTLTGGSIFFGRRNAPAFLVSSFAQSGGTVYGGFTVTGNATFSGQIKHRGPSSTTVLQGESSFNAKLDLTSKHNFENQGVFTVIGGRIACVSGVSRNAVTNAAGGVFDIEGNFMIGGHHGTRAGIDFLNAGTVKIANAATANVDASFTNTGAVEIGSGALVLGGDARDHSTFAGSVSGAGELVFGGGTYALNADLILTVSNWTIRQGGDGTAVSVAVNETLSYGGNFSQGAGTALTVAMGDKLRLAGVVSLAGMVDGAGTLTFAGGTQAVNAGAILDVANWVLSNDAVTSLNEPLTYGGAFIEADGSILTLAAGALTLAGSARLAGTVNGTGNLAFTGGTQALNTNFNLTVPQWIISDGATTSVNEILSYAGAFSQAAGTTVTIAAGDKLRLTGTTSLAGAVSGAGTLTFAGGSHAMNGADLTVANWVISNGAVARVVGMTYTGAFVQAAATTLTLAGGTLNLTGPARLAGTLNGRGTVELSDAALGDLTIGGKLVVLTVGTVHQTGVVTIGDDTKRAARLEIAGAYRIDNDSGIAGGTPNNGIGITGQLIKVGGAGTSVIGVDVVDVGGIEAASGTLDFTRSVDGVGTMAVDTGATLEVDLSASSNLEMTFNGEGAVLVLGSPAEFAATINGFAATDTIDLLARTATAATLGPGDTLVITNGAATVATLQLAGDYSAATFHVASDSNGGTNITVTGHSAPVAPFVAAIAGFGSNIHGPVSVLSEPHYAHPPMLSVPRMAMA